MSTTFAPAPHLTACSLLADQTVLAVARRLHDQKCMLKDVCMRRDAHALDCFERQVRNMFGILAEARDAGEL
ncbi:hypothetical protein [Arthrobacter sp. A2-55]|uniref:hypothetical protein n=1 Tax=Arthrobacter sp. A2-55 TaxID=2897337 RepID=UPI0021CD7A3F|nr:hypothetical protein [Arthrobacter sp. A2-55]MCU6480166.1 hypothetical protein [Arthrobacter sp. A2-55]